MSLTGTIPVVHNGKKKDLPPASVIWVWEWSELNLKQFFPAVPQSGKTYNIPVCVWLEESYPQTCPICYIKPTRDMMILASEHITCNGEVLLPYLDEWRAVRMNDCCSVAPCFSGVTSVFSVRVPVTWSACCKSWPPFLKTLHHYVWGLFGSLCKSPVGTTLSHYNQFL